MELHNYHALKSTTPFTLPELVSQLNHIESFDNPDEVLDLSSLRMSDNQNIVIPSIGEFALTDWSRGQLANLTGIKFDRWFENASAREKAEEMNRRFSRATVQIKVRTSRAMSYEFPADGTLKAFVSPSYMAISDAFVGSLVLSALQRTENEFPVIRSAITTQSTSYSIRVGRPYKVGDIGDVGDIWGGILIQNSGVGYSSLRITLHLTRLVCKNGMTLPIGDAELLRRRHQGSVEMQLWERISSRLVGIGEKLTRGISTISRSTAITVDDPRKVIESILQRNHLSKRMVEPLLTTYQREHHSAFGISQALTDAQTHEYLHLTPEERLQLEDAAGSYLETAIA